MQILNSNPARLLDEKDVLTKIYTCSNKTIFSNAHFLHCLCCTIVSKFSGSLISLSDFVVN